MSTSSYLAETFNLSTGGFGGPVSRTEQKIRSYAKLPPGWHYGSGGPAQPRIVQIALEYLWFFLSFGYSEADAFPGVDGAIMVSAYRGKHCVEVTVEVDRSFAVAHQCDGETRFYEPGLSGSQACTELSNIVRGIEQEECGTSDSSIYDTITTRTPASLRTWRSPRWEQARRSFLSHAPTLPAAQRAITSNVSTPGWGVIQPYFGDSTKHKSTHNAPLSSATPKKEIDAITR
jgi:hypothetical protein